MLKNLKNFYYPNQVKEVAKILADHGGKAAIVAGGTILSRIDSPKTEVAVDIMRCGLSFIKEERDGLHIGATTTFQELYKSPVVQQFAHGMVSKASGLVSTHLIRNAGTVGGSIVYSYSYNNMPPAFLALDAKVLIVNKSEERWVDFSEFSKKHGTLIVGETGLLKEILVPSKTKNWRSSYLKFARSYSDWEAQIIVATALGFQDETCENARVVVGAIVQRPVRVVEAENEILGDHPDTKSFERAAEIVCENVSPMVDWRSSKDYRKEVLKVLVKRSLLECSKF